MPIRLDVKPYCADCPNFEVDIDKDISTLTGVGDDMETINVTCTTISCAYKDECALKIRYLEKQVKNKKIMDDFIKQSKIPEEYSKCVCNAYSEEVK